MNALIKATAKRYRYTGKERDEESGLYYHGARYYIPWLCRWSAVDPINSENYNLQKGYGLEKNIERPFLELTASNYEYCYDNPTRFNDQNGEQPPQNATFRIEQRSFAPWKKFGDLFGINNFMIPDNQFRGDDRGFSLSDIATMPGYTNRVTTRLYSSSKFTLNKNGLLEHYVGASITVGKPSFGMLIGLPEERTGFSDAKHTATFKNNWLEMRVYGSDPLVKPAPDIDWKLTAKTSFTKDRQNNYFLKIEGKIAGKGFPAYESFIEDKKGTRVFLFTIASPKENDLAKELTNPLYDTFKEQLFEFQLDKEGNFTGQMWIGERKWCARCRSYEETTWRETTISEWNKQHLNKKPAPDYGSEK